MEEKVFDTPWSLRGVYAYTDAGRLASRVWARGVTTDYSYDALGQLVGIGYSDSTPDVIFAYDRRGNMVSVADASGTRVFAHDLDGQTVVTDTLSALGRDFVLLESHDDFGRTSGYAISNTVDGVTSHIAGMCNSFDPFGRISQVTIAGVASPFRYDYLPGTDLQQSLSMPNGVTRETAYAAYRDLSESIIHTNAEGTVLTRRTFTRDAEGNLSGRTQYRLGDATNRVDAFSQNARGELVSAIIGTNDYSYAFDPIGNRMTADESEFFAAYSANSLNQYTRISNSVPSCEFIPEFDADGNQTLIRTSTGIWHVTYNAENRPIVFSNDTGVIEMAYDYQGRRFEYKESVNATLTRHERFLYRGYLQIAALDLTDATNVIHTIVWDPTEPTATRPLALRTQSGWFTYGFDQVKNVTELFDSAGDIAAAYDYAPFGAVTASSGNAVAVNPITFSSEIDDNALGLIHYTFRLLNTLDGRWIVRDPIEETGGLNLYLMMANCSIMTSDYNGLLSYLDMLEKINSELSKVKNAYQAAQKCLERIKMWRPGSTRGGNTSDKYRHCLASCELGMDCGVSISYALGVMKEASDLIRGWLEVANDFWLPPETAANISFYLEGGDLEDSIGDFTANFLGHTCVASPDGCECCCKHYYSD